MVNNDFVDLDSDRRVEGCRDRVRAYYGMASTVTSLLAVAAAVRLLALVSDTVVVLSVLAVFES